MSLTATRCPAKSHHRSCGPDPFQNMVEALASERMASLVLSVLELVRRTRIHVGRAGEAHHLSSVTRVSILRAGDDQHWPRGCQLQEVVDVESLEGSRNNLRHFDARPVLHLVAKAAHGAAHASVLHSLVERRLEQSGIAAVRMPENSKSRRIDDVETGKKRQCCL